SVLASRSNLVARAVRVRAARLGRSHSFEWSRAVLGVPRALVPSAGGCSRRRHWDDLPSVWGLVARFGRSTTLCSVQSKPALAGTRVGSWRSGSRVGWSGATILRVVI